MVINLLLLSNIKSLELLSLLLQAQARWILQDDLNNLLNTHH